MNGAAPTVRQRLRQQTSGSPRPAERGRGTSLEPTGESARAEQRLRRVLASQRADGAFPSRVLLDRRSGLEAPDGNAFVTALVLHHLLALPGHLLRATGLCGAHVEALDRALGFLERCRVAPDAVSNPGRWGRDVAGAFRFYPFYPAGAKPEWMQTRLAADVDDTVLCAGVLLTAGRMEAAEARDLVERVLEPHRLHDRTAAARWPWVEAGAYRTWLDPKAKPNPVDCTVNANAAALLARLELRDHPAYAAAVATVCRGIEWAGGSAAHGRLITPFYPDLTELGHAVVRARRAGVDAFAGLSVSHTDDEETRDDTPLRNHPVCSSADGRVDWLAPVLQIVREIAGEAGALRPHPVSINPSTGRGTLP